jgi:hypothetical protein
VDIHHHHWRVGVWAQDMAFAMGMPNVYTRRGKGVNIQF